MSKRSSARFEAARRLAAATLLFLSVSGCDLSALPGMGGRDSASGEDSVLVAPDTNVPEVASAEPGRVSRTWRPTDQNARRRTGNLTTSLENVRSGPLVLAFANGITVRLERVAQAAGRERTFRGGPAFAETLGAESGAQVVIYRVLSENVDKVAPEGGLCRTRQTSYVAVSEYVNAAGDWVFRLGGFLEREEPGSQLDSDPGFCGAFAYVLA